MLKVLLRRSATITASVLETGASVLRGLAETRDEEAPEPAASPAASPAATQTKASAPAPASPATKPAPPKGTRSRISNPKAARRVRAREG